MTTDEKTTEIEIPRNNPLGNIVHVQFPNHGRTKGRKKKRVTLSSGPPPVMRRTSVMDWLDDRVPPWIVRMAAVLGILALSLLIL